MMIVGFFYVLLALFISIGPLFEWIEKLNAPGWLDVILHIVAVTLWLSGMAFMYYAEKAVMTKKKHD